MFFITKLVAKGMNMFMNMLKNAVVFKFVRGELPSPIVLGGYSIHHKHRSEVTTVPFNFYFFISVYHLILNDDF